MRLNGEAIYGSQRCALSAGNLGEWTRRGNTGYLHVFHWPGEEIVLPLVATEALSATVLATDKSDAEPQIEWTSYPFLSSACTTRP
jgi:hypothetical protein